MRRLTRTLLAGGVVYPAGTAEGDVKVEVRRDDVWTEAKKAETPQPEKKAPAKRVAKKSGS